MGTTSVSQLEELIETAVLDVFRTMLNWPVHAEELIQPIDHNENHVASSVGFIGKATGVVFLYVKADFAARLTSRFLGLGDDPADEDELINDAMGELANMVVGKLKSVLSDQGLPCTLTVPSIVRGSQLKIETTRSTERSVFNFRSGSDLLTVELLLKSDNPISVV